LKRFINDAFALFIVPDFGITSEREVFAQGVTLKTVICKNTAKVWVAAEENTVEIPSLSLVPISTTEKPNSTRDRIRLSGIRLHSDPSAMLDTQQMVDDFETFLPLGVVGTTDIHDALELTLGVITKEG